MNDEPLTGSPPIIYTCTHCGGVGFGDKMLYVWDGKQIVIIHKRCVDAFAKELQKYGGG